MFLNEFMNEFMIFVGAIQEEASNTTFLMFLVVPVHNLKNKCTFVIVLTCPLGSSMQSHTESFGIYAKN